ncbi:phospholipase D-like domain-containing protein [uncultured Herbaspirillum sp.]|uniref:phospholipase D-like domain-containing protein n=1 Tax=uncultured Herbaspirillum sp. TaxID=160236 RepID=UPI002587208B|nr:phospholipase D-like domain-containing protein [uncultured Herbaspirillum sp.]
MRVTASSNGVRVNAIAGTRVVLLGFDIDQAQRAGCLGFAIERHDLKTGEVVWMRGMKTFEKTQPHTTLGQMFSSQQHPFQSFQWSDYSVNPGQGYTYEVHPTYGTPQALEVRDGAEVTVSTETEWGEPHSVFFNRGSVATQEYARRFQNRRPSEVGQAAYDWLSRGLHEALLAFIARADSSDWKVYAAIYEFQDAPALDALAQASARGAEVHALFDAIPGDDHPLLKNEKAIAAAGIDALCIPRTHGKIMHNKFVVLTYKGTAKAVWTGSTNWTENGIYGHSNLGHVVQDDVLAQAFLTYWERLSTDPKTDRTSDYKASNVAQTPAPVADWPRSLACVFSPRSNPDALDWYGELAASASSGLFASFAFGMNKVFQKVFARDDDVLRFALMDKRTAQTREPARSNDLAAIHAIAARKNVVLAVGNNIVTNEFDRWLAEMHQIVDHVNVPWIHTKYMLIDPLGDKPIVISGSANFSDASTTENDENMLVIHADKRVADIYLGEFMRLHSHYAFREAVAIHVEHGGKPDDWRPQYLLDTDTWQSPYFNPDDSSGRFLRRQFFAQAMSL